MRNAYNMLNLAEYGPSSATYIKILCPSLNGKYSGHNPQKNFKLTVYRFLYNLNRLSPNETLNYKADND